MAGEEAYCHHPTDVMDTWEIANIRQLGDCWNFTRQYRLQVTAFPVLSVGILRTIWLRCCQLIAAKVARFWLCSCGDCWCCSLVVLQPAA
jgi:hypothetical protein